MKARISLKPFEITVDTEDSSSVLKVPLGKERTLYMVGSLYYYNKIQHFSRGKEKCISEIANIFTTTESFLKNVEGAFVCFLVDNAVKSFCAFSDRMSTKELYYCQDAGNVYVSPSMKGLPLKGCKLDSFTLVNILLMLYPPKKSTIFNKVKRLSACQILSIDKGGVEIKSIDQKSMPICSYDGQSIEEYKCILENSILSRASHKFNVVQLSGGWDSTFLLSVLCKHYGREKVRPAIYEMILSDGRTFNRIEINKCKRIAKFFGVKLDVIRSDTSSPELLNLWSKEIYGNSMYEHLFTRDVNQFLFTNKIKAKYGSDVVVFNGEACDSMHNFGFSQYISFQHESYDFRQYADKMKTFLYSPTFYQKVLNGTYEDDAVYQLFKNSCSGVEYAKGNNEINKIFNYLFSFVFSDSRIPFADVDNLPFINKSTLKDAKRQLFNEYFRDIIRDLKPSNIYYHFLFGLYLNFHLQSHQITKITKPLQNARLPFMDYELMSFMAKAPESWGRSLDYNEVKYPLKQLIRKNCYKYPLHIISEPGHSYISETIPSVSWFNDFLCNSSLIKRTFDTKVFKQRAQEAFDSSLFDLKKMNLFVDQFKNRRQSLRPLRGQNLNLLVFLLHYCRK